VHLNQSPHVAVTRRHARHNCRARAGSTQPVSDPFQKLMAQLEYSLFIVTAASGDTRAGCLVGFASQVSIHPSRFLVGISVKNRTFLVAKDAETLVVHFVPEDADELAVLFGGETGDEIDKFARVEWREGPGGAPVITQLENWFAGRVLEKFDLGDHLGFLLEPIDGETHQSAMPLTFRRAKWIEPGHEP
jgi:flavin reductase (DIM6/NTAB) family NADH-FMN oxidoreductase RutF